MQAQTAMANPAKFVICESTILDGFWIHRVLESEGIESHVVDPASIAVSRRHRRAKTDRIDGEALVRTLLAYKRGEPRVCAMVRVPTPDEEDQRRLCRELKTLVSDHHQWTGSLRAREILDHWSEALPKFVKVFPNEYKRALAEISLKAMTALGEIRATTEADDAIAKARTAGKAAKVVAPK